MNLFRKKSVRGILEQLEAEDSASTGKLKKHLGVRDLTALGIAAIIGAGIFSTIGKASADGGPAVIFLFIFTAVACGFAAFCYAEFASTIPVSGSAYTYSYVSFGELFAWIIGWALIMEYAIGNIVVAISWSGYFSTLLTHIHIPFLGFPDGIHLPAWTGIDYFSAKRAYEATLIPDSDPALLTQEGYLAWTSAPTVAGIRFIMDMPALIVNVLITWLVYRGIRESRNASNLMVAIKVIVVIMVICLGAAYVNVENWSDFMPNGMAGVLAGVSAVFFAYIGFDAISTTAEECHNPQRDLPRGMMYSIIICTVLYILIALVLTGMVSYSELNVDDPLAFVFSKIGLGWISGIIAVSAVVAMASVMLVFQLGQPRIWMSMSRDGLLPKKFASVHSRYGTPGFATIVTGLLVGIPIFFIDMDTVVDLCSIGTLFAFILVCGGVLVLRGKPGIQSKFKVPYVNGQYFVPLLFIISFILVYRYNQQWLVQYSNPFKNPDSIPMIIFFLTFLGLSIFSFTRKLSLIPVLGIITCTYLMAQIQLRNWIGFIIWLAAGLIIYFSYSYKNSRLNSQNLK